MKLPNAREAFVDIDKLRGYCLNQFHPRGKHKARLFSSILGLTVDNAEELKQALLEAVQTNDAEIGDKDQYGKRYLIDFIMTTSKGKAMIRSTWIILIHENFARFTSCYVMKKES